MKTYILKTGSQIPNLVLIITVVGFSILILELLWLTFIKLPPQHDSLNPHPCVRVCADPT